MPRCQRTRMKSAHFAVKPASARGKSHAERNPELVALVRQLRRRRPKGGQRSLRDISAELGRGIMNERG
jgi:hypothetical protein